jgi:hypothetical protein
MRVTFSALDAPDFHCLSITCRFFGLGISAQEIRVQGIDNGFLPSRFNSMFPCQPVEPICGTGHSVSQRTNFSELLHHDDGPRRVQADAIAGNPVVIQCSGSKRPALADISPVNSRRTNSHLADVNGGQWNEVTPHHSFSNGYYKRSYTPLQIQEHFVRSSVDWRWKQKEGIKLDRAIFKTINDDIAKKKSSGKKSDQIDSENLGNLIWLFLDFVYPQRKGKSKARALVGGIYLCLLKEFPDYFHDVMLDQSKIHA